MNWKAFIAGLGCALVGGVLLFVYMKRFEREVSHGTPTPILVATQNIPFGERITESMVIALAMPSAFVDTRHILLRDKSSILGIRTTIDVQANEAILWTDLAMATSEHRTLASQIPSGLRATSIRADVTSTLGGLLRPGDRVDIFLTTELPPARTVLLLQSVMVLAIGQDIGTIDSAGNTGGFDQVTVSATVDQAAALTQAAVMGTLSLALRGRNDFNILAEQPETTNEDVLEPVRRQRFLRRESTSNVPLAPPTSP